MLLRQLSYAIKNQLKAPTRGISCLSLVLYGRRIGSEGLDLFVIDVIFIFPRRQNICLSQDEKYLYRILFPAGQNIINEFPVN